MLSCVLNSERAIEVNIRIIRTFSKMREMLLTHKDLLLEMEEIRNKVSGQEEQIALIFEYLNQFEQAKQKELEQQNISLVNAETQVIQAASALASAIAARKEFIQGTFEQELLNSIERAII